MTGEVATVIGTTEETAVGVETTIVKDVRRRPGAMTTVEDKIRMVGTGVILMERTGSVLALLNPTDAKDKSRTGAEAPVRMVVAARKAILWTYLAAMATTCQMFKFYCYKMCTRISLIGYSGPFGKAD